jgi:hypothetical protein
MQVIKGTVLFVSDGDDISSLVVNLLGRAGCQARKATYTSVLSEVRKEHFNFIIVDCTARDQAELFERLCVLVPSTIIFLFTGLDPTQKVLSSVVKQHAEQLVPLTFDSLINDLFHDKWYSGKVEKIRLPVTNDA